MPGSMLGAARPRVKVSAGSEERGRVSQAFHSGLYEVRPALSL
jgi:hypothetical protein